MCIQTSDYVISFSGRIDKTNSTLGSALTSHNEYIMKIMSVLPILSENDENETFAYEEKNCIGTIENTQEQPAHFLHVKKKKDRNNNYHTHAGGLDNILDDFQVALLGKTGIDIKQGKNYNPDNDDQ
jgi:hypothetical protein